MVEILRVGGKQYNWNSSLSLIDLQPWRGIRSVDWSDQLEVETVYSQTQDGKPIGDTSGQYSVDNFVIKMLWEQWEQLKAYLAFAAPGIPPGSRGLPGTFGQTKFSFQLTVTEPLEIGAIPIMLIAGPCRVIGQKQTTAAGSAVLEAELKCWVQSLTVNGSSLWSGAIPGL